MAYGVPRDLWRGGEIMRSAAQKGATKASEGRGYRAMTRVHIPLDPNKAGREAVSLENNLRKLIVGQDEAIQQIVNIYQMNLTGLSTPGRPIGNFLFLGPTGSGKTRIVEATAESLVKNSRAVIKIDCAEFQHSHEIAKLIGSPPGYLGHRETHPLLSQEVINQHHTDTMKISFILFDEIEKASDSLWNLLLGILDKGTLTLGDNRKVDFSKALIFMTSNLGATEMNALMNPKIGFSAPELKLASQNGYCDAKLDGKVARSGLEAARKKFTPEFMNRLDKIVVFRPLGTEQLRKILDIELNMVQQRIFNTSADRSFVFTMSESSKDHLLKEGTDTKYGARHLKRAIERLLVHPMSNLIATEQVRGGDWIRVDYDEADQQISFMKEAEGLPIQEMARMVDTTVSMPMAAMAVAASESTKTQSARKAR